MMEERPAPHPFDYVTRDQIQDLWSIGYTIVKRSRHIDPFHVPPEMVPQGRSYQWWHLVHDKVHFTGSSGERDLGWAPVPASRHDGYFMPFGTVGAIEVGGLGLFEKSKFEVDQEKAAQVKAAHKLVSDWSKQVAEDGFSGGYMIGGVGADVGGGEKVFKNTAAKTVDTTVRFPPDMLRHAAEVFAERDRLYADLQARWEANSGGHEPWHRQVLAQYHAALAEDPGILKGPTFNALLLPIAVENVRNKLKEGKTDE
jgi:hypothetical protein